MPQKRTEATLLGMEQIRHYVGNGLGNEMLESLIEEGECKDVGRLHRLGNPTDNSEETGILFPACRLPKKSTGKMRRFQSARNNHPALFMTASA